MSLKEDINFSIWCDFIERDFLENGFKHLIKNEIIQGATSNPAIFESSISTSPAYRQQLNMLKVNNAKTIYEELALKDIKRAAELLESLHNKDFDDGFISIEVDPTLCDDSEGTIEEGKRIFTTLGQENVMIKIPATEAGYIAMKELVSQGINVNATLIFSPTQAKKCAEAFSAGMEISTNKDVKAVISVFVSRFDRMCDASFATKELPTAKLGIINAIKCYHVVNSFSNNNIRTLFASTGVKGNDLNASYYIDNLIYPNSVNTAPLDTIESWLSEGKNEPSKFVSEKECDEFFILLKSKGVDMGNIYANLLEDGLKAFVVSFEGLLKKLTK